MGSLGDVPLVRRRGHRRRADVGADDQRIDRAPRPPPRMSRASSCAGAGSAPCCACGSGRPCPTASRRAAARLPRRRRPALRHDVALPLPRCSTRRCCSRGSPRAPTGSTRSTTGRERWYRSNFPLERVRRQRADETGGPVVVGEACPYYMFHPAGARPHRRAPARGEGRRRPARPGGPGLVGLPPRVPPGLRDLGVRGRARRRGGPAGRRRARARRRPDPAPLPPAPRLRRPRPLRGAARAAVGPRRPRSAAWCSTPRTSSATRPR